MLTMEMDEELPEAKHYASFERYDEFSTIQNAFLTVDLTSEPSGEDNIAETEQLRKLVMILCEYQEQSYLLDPYLENLVVPVAECLRVHARIRISDSTTKSSISRVGRLGDLLYNYIRCRGHKAITSFFPHEIADVTIAIDFMVLKDGPAADPLMWPLRYVALLWLSLVCRIPFDLEQFDEVHHTGRTADSLEFIAKKYLDKAGLEREGAAILLSRFYMRKDTKQRFSDFLQWSCSVVQSNEIFQSLGALQVLCEFVKSGAPEQVKATTEDLMVISETISGSNTLMGNTLMRKYRTKLISRIGLRLIPPRPAFSRIEMRTLQGGTHPIGQGCVDDDDVEVPNELDDILDALFKAIRDKDTVVRWSAAKGIAKISDRLPRDFATQVLENILQLFSIHSVAGTSVCDMPSIAEATWHGACLASAEMARRALIPPTLLPEVLDWLSKALYFDIRKGAHSIGSNVRDAAAYVIWALARAQDRASFSPHANKLAQSLIAVALYDREVSIRRAASAAFQEHVGRMGLFPHGIDILRKTDFYSVSIRRNAFLLAAPQTAEHHEYRPALVSHLISIALRHWDVRMRQLGAKSLRLICEIELDALAPPCIQRLARQLGSVDLVTIHGALLALKEIAESYRQLGPSRDGVRREIFICISHIPESLILAPRNEQLLGATCSLIAASMTQEDVDLQDGTSVPYWQKLVDHGLRNRGTDAQEEAAAAMATSLGYLLGVLDYNSHPHGLPQVVDCLLDSVSMKSATRMTNVEARRNAFEAIPKVISRVAQNLVEHLRADTICALFDALDSGLDDYTMDERGDVGSWIRIACIKGISSVIEDLFHISKDIPRFRSFLPAHRYHHVVGRILRQGVERLDNVRQIAGESFLRIIGLPLPSVEGAEDWRLRGEGLVRDIFWSENDENPASWNNGEWLFPKAVRLLDIPEYRKEILIGFMMSVSTRTNSTQRSASSSLVNYVQKLPLRSEGTVYDLPKLAEDLIEYANAHLPSNNIVVPVLQTLNTLFEADAFTHLLGCETGAICAENLISISTRNMLRLKNVQRIQESMKIIVNLLAFPSVVKTCLPKLVGFLTHGYPRIRSGTAEYLYLVLQSKDLGWEPGDRVEELLLETEWSSMDVEGVKEAAQTVVNELVLNLGTQ